MAVIAIRFKNGGSEGRLSSLHPGRAREPVATVEGSQGWGYLGKEAILRGYPETVRSKLGGSKPLSITGISAPPRCRRDPSACGQLAMRSQAKEEAGSVRTEALHAS